MAVTGAARGPSRPDVVVVGGGIGGLAAAFALSLKGVSVRVLEQAPEFGEVGAGIQLAPNCTRILHELGLLEDLQRLGVMPTDMVMRDAVDGEELTRLDLKDLRRRYDFPYLVIHRSDLHATLLAACRSAGVDLRTDARAVRFEAFSDRAAAVMADGDRHEADVVLAADGLHSVARTLLVQDEPVSSAYVAYRAAVPLDGPTGRGIDLSEVVVHVGPRCHFVHYGLRGGDMLNQVAVFESPRARRGEDDWGTPDELDAAFASTTAHVRDRIPLMWRDRWWRMFDRDPITTWTQGRLALIGDAAHPPLQYMAQGAIMAIEDAWVLAEHTAAHWLPSGGADWDAVLAAYQAVRPEHCRRVVETARAWGELWHLDGEARLARNAILRARDVHDYAFVDWIYGPTALRPEDEPPMFDPIALRFPHPTR